MTALLPLLPLAVAVTLANQVHDGPVPLAHLHIFHIEPDQFRSAQAAEP